MPLFQEQLLRIAMVAAGFTGGQAEDLRRAFGFKRSERRMKQIEQQLRDGMTRQGISGEAAGQIITAITSFALYGFPESHAASFALLAYASAYLKAHYPAAFYTALLNNQPMGFYHPSTLVKDAQRRGVRFQSIDVQVSEWDCTVEADGSIRLGLRYVSGLRQEAGKRMISGEGRRDLAEGRPAVICPKCACDDPSMLERVDRMGWFCNNCSHDWVRPDRLGRDGGRFASLDDLIAAAGLRRDEALAPRRYRRAQFVRLRPPVGVVAGRTCHEAGRRVIHHDHRGDTQSPQRLLTMKPLRALRPLRFTWTVRSSP